MMVDPWIQLAHGGQFNYANPASSSFTIEEVAHALSHMARFAGHTRRFYPVITHSCMVHDHIDGTPRQKFAGLLHDGHEGFVVDMPTPAKVQLPEYKPFELSVQAPFLARFGLTMDDVNDPVVRRADLEALATEKRDLLPPMDDVYGVWKVLEGIEPWADTCPDWSFERARREFLDRFYAYDA